MTANGSISISKLGSVLMGGASGSSAEANVFPSKVSARFLLTVLLGLSVVMHLLLAQAIYFFSTREALLERNLDKTGSTQQVTFTISAPTPPAPTKSRPPDIQKPSRPVETNLQSLPTVRAPMPPVAMQSRPVAQRKPSLSELEALGNRHMRLVRAGAFPSLTLSYPDPAKYIGQMYKMGAKTLLLLESAGVLYEIDLLRNRTTPFSKEDLQGFSMLKRVIEDDHWNSIKAGLAARLNTPIEKMRLILALPQTLEVRWVGHQVSVFRLAGVSVDRVQSVDAHFEDGCFRVEALHLTDGRVLKTQDAGFPKSEMP